MSINLKIDTGGCKGLWDILCINFIYVFWGLWLHVFLKLVSKIFSFCYLLNALDRTAYRRLADIQNSRQFNGTRPQFSIGKISQQVSSFDSKGLFAGAKHLFRFDLKPLGHPLHKHLEGKPSGF
jgi:hypothetical protein